MSEQKEFLQIYLEHQKECFRRAKQTKKQTIEILRDLKNKILNMKNGDGMHYRRMAGEIDRAIREIDAMEVIIK